MDNVLCTKSHEYVSVEDGMAKIGITSYAVEQLGDVVFVELPEIGSTWSKGDVFGTIESVKAASELYMPIGGKIVEVNEKLADQPELVNNDCFEKGWFVKVTDFNSDDLKDAMNCEEYKNYIEKEE